MSNRVDIAFDGCFGVFQQGSSRRGVIFCAGHGYDELCTYRNFALFADTLAEQGLWTLRFDYHGAGNSTGSDDADDQLPIWLGNIAAAVDLMKRQAGVSEIVLVGYRLGGLLAALAASRSSDVTALVLIAPALSGRFYLREMQLQAQLYPVRQDEDGKDGGVSSAGFTLNANTAQALKSVKLEAVSQPYLKRVLIMSSTFNDEHPFAKAFAGTGCAVEIAPFEALAELSVDPIRSLSAVKPFAAAVPFLTADIAPAPPRPAVQFPPAQLDAEGWSETPHRFGPDGRLFGISCTPPPGKAKGPTVLFLNGGASRTTGWARLTVRLARRLATLGYASFRMDFAGLGESLAVDPKRPVILYDDAFQADIDAALAWLRRRDHAPIAVFGACSGAHAAFHSAKADQRIDALIMVNLLRFDISREEASQVGGAVSFRSTSNYLQRMRELDGWKKLIAGGRSKATALAKEYRRRGTIMLGSRLGHAASIVLRSDRFAAPVMRGFRAITARGGRTLIVYGDDDNGLDELAIHVGPQASLIRKDDAVQFGFLTETDHNLTARSAQDQLAALVERFLHSDA